MFPKSHTFVAAVLMTLGVLFLLPCDANAQVGRTPSPRLVSPSPTASAEATLTPTPSISPTPEVRPDITQSSEEALGPLEAILASQEIGPMGPANIIKHAIRNSVDAGVPVNTIVLLLLLPLVVAVIAAARHLIGIRGFGIFLPAALSVVFLAVGPIMGIGLFLIIVTISTIARVAIRKLKIKLQYLPRMAIILWTVVVGVLAVLFAAPYLNLPALANVSIFPVLFLVLLAEDFTKVQLGKSVNTAINLTIETLIVALVSYIFLTLQAIQAFALLNPEVLLFGILVFDFVVGKFIGLRFLEYWRFRKLMTIK